MCLSQRDIPTSTTPTSAGYSGITASQTLQGGVSAREGSFRPTLLGPPEMPSSMPQSNQPYVFSPYGYPYPASFGVTYPPPMAPPGQGMQFLPGYQLFPFTTGTGGPFYSSYVQPTVTRSDSSLGLTAQPPAMLPVQPAPSLPQLLVNNQPYAPPMGPSASDSMSPDNQQPPTVVSAPRVPISQPTPTPIALTNPLKRKASNTLKARAGKSVEPPWNQRDSAQSPGGQATLSLSSSTLPTPEPSQDIPTSTRAKKGDLPRIKAVSDTDFASLIARYAPSSTKVEKGENVSQDSSCGVDTSSILPTQDSMSSVFEVEQMLEREDGLRLEIDEASFREDIQYGDITPAPDSARSLRCSTSISSVKSPLPQIGTPLISISPSMNGSLLLPDHRSMSRPISPQMSMQPEQPPISTSRPNQARSHGDASEGSLSVNIKDPNLGTPVPQVLGLNQSASASSGQASRASSATPTDKRNDDRCLSSHKPQATTTSAKAKGKQREEGPAINTVPNKGISRSGSNKATRKQLLASIAAKGRHLASLTSDLEKDLAK
ncbi:hypothetical protein FRC03_010043 [Tulasnella sp. 419]|nr:hypothetical protein FRC03_010043 [Tulasnella sp. 419]